jgi:hypothetical protein
MALARAAVLTPLACDPPGGPDLAIFLCVCDDEAFGDRIVIGPARACTDLNDEEQALAEGCS